MPDRNKTAISLHERRLIRLRRLSSTMAVLCVAVLLLLVALMVFYFATTPWTTLVSHLGMAKTDAPGNETLLRICGGLITLLPLTALGLGLMAARSCFVNLAHGEVFSHGVVAGLRGFAFWLLLSTLLQVMAGAALSILFSLGAGGPGQLAISLGSDTLLALLFAGTVLVISTVMSEAVYVAQDNAQIV